MTKPRKIRTIIALVAAAIWIAEGLPTHLAAQTLARPGWAGSGLTAQSWFKHAIFYEIDTRTFQDSNGDGVGDIRGVTQRIEYIHSLGVDAILIKPLGGVQAAGSSSPMDPSLGTFDDLDDLTLQASRLKIRILLELPGADPSLARFWLNRGIAGFYVPGDAAVNAVSLQAVRKLLLSFVGQRVLITDADVSGSTATKHALNELMLYRADLNASAPGSSVADLRMALDRSQVLVRGVTPVLEILNTLAPAPSAAEDPGLLKISLAAVLLNRSASLIVAGQELGLMSAPTRDAPMPWGQPPTATAEQDDAPKPPKPAAPAVASPDRYTRFIPYVRPAAAKKPAVPDPASVAGQEANPGSPLNFYRRLSLLHHGGSAIFDGAETVLDHDAQNALIWVRRPATPSSANPTIVVACNLSGEPIMLSLSSDMTRLKLRGNFLRTLVRSDDAIGGISIDPLTVPAYGTYVGELRR